MTSAERTLGPTHDGAASGDARDRRAGALVGLAIGDAAGWPARIHRSHLLPAWTRRLRRELDAFAESEDVTTLPSPFALNQSTQPLRLGPSDDAEWVAWTADWLIEHGPEITRQDVHDHWRAIAVRDQLPRGRISVATAADALVEGIEPPVTGHDNPHWFDDAAAVRAVSIGAWARDPDKAAQLAEWDAQVTNAGDGVAAAQAIATAVAAAIAGEPGDTVVELALRLFPERSAIGSSVRRGLAATAEAGSPMDVVAILDDGLDNVYSYGVAATDTVGVALALVHATWRLASSVGEAVAAAACLPRLADSAPALTGALIGAIQGYESLPAAWTERTRHLTGCCLAELEGRDLVDVAYRLDDVHVSRKETP